MTEVVKLRDLLGQLDGAAAALAGAVRPDTGGRWAADALARLPDAIDAALESALDVDLPGLLAGAWNRGTMLAAYRDPGKTPPGSPAHVALGDHEVEILLDPELTVQLGPMTLATLPLAIEVRCNIEGAILTIEEAKITAMRIATIETTAELCWGDAKFKIPWPAKRLKLSGTIPVRPPFSLA
jgi:hypothetical protein